MIDYLQLILNWASTMFALILSKEIINLYTSYKNKLKEKIIEIKKIETK
ncbi:MAG: hypothetical protein MUO82_10855 [Candidatus Thermoplasmatota archaeon]|nr:hypothetical protein [Candidatus Thermoplasmatota archaeon]